VLGESARALAESGLLLELSRLVTGTLDLKEVMRHAFAALRRLLDFGGGAIQLIEDGDLVAVATDPPTTPEAMSVRIPVGRGVSGRIAQTGEPIYIPDITADPRVHWNGKRTGVSTGVRSYFGAPLILRGAPIGVVQIDSPLVDGFGEEARALMLAFVPTIAAAVQNATMFRRETQTLGELREAEQLKHEFLAVITHELRTPIASIIGFAETLAARAGALDQGLVAEFGSRLSAAGRRLRRLIDDLLDVSQIDRGSLSIETMPCAVEPIVQSAVVDAGTFDRAVMISVEDGRRALVDPARLQQVLANLIGNAAKFSAPPAPIDVRVFSDDGRVAVSVADHGVGISPEVRGRIFDRFFQAQPAATRTVSGVGVGLYLVKALCDRMGATIDVTSEVGVGTCFTLRLRAA
jgi:hypothetical protein